MPKPPTSERGRRARQAPATPVVTRRRRQLGLRRRRPAAESAPKLPRAWRPIFTTVAALAGLGVAIYLTLVHYDSSIPLACSTTGIINCDLVTTSPQSIVFGIPVSVLGLAFFVPMLALSLPFTWRSANPWVAPARLALAVTGIGFVAYLLYTELFVIHAICLWCTSVHVLTFLIFAAVVTGWAEAREPRCGPRSRKPSSRRAGKRTRN